MNVFFFGIHERLHYTVIYIIYNKWFVVEIVSIFHTVFARVYHYAISELCKGLYHHNGV